MTDSPNPTIWWREPSLSSLGVMTDKTLVSHLGIELTEIGPDFLVATMPADERTFQPMGIIHGGANVALAETLASFAANLVVDPSRQYAVGLDINANHLRAVRSGRVTGTARPIHLGRSTQVWEIRIVDDRDRLTCLSRMTASILDRPFIDTSS